jgi:UDPglucose 6-dehydrogenase/GDP-mannose 6-dehydrogenase
MDERSIDVQRHVYARFAQTPRLETNNKTAEMIKYTSNSVLATMISFSNEMANVCSALGGVDVADVMRGVHLARYFTTTTASGERVKAPITSFLWAGCGYGGSCLPKDTKALAAHGAAHGAPMPMLESVIATNLAQPARMLALLERRIPSLQGRRVAVLGLAFKEDTDDMRESPAIPIVRMLVERGARVSAYDPIAGDAARPLLPDTVQIKRSLEEAVDGVEAVMLVTRWDEFRRLPEVLQRQAEPPLLVDGRRMLAREAYARYDGIGL